MPTPGVKSTGSCCCKFLKQNIIIAAVYVLICASTVIYLALWQFDNIGSSTGKLASQYRILKDKSSNSRDLLGLFDLSNIKDNLRNVTMFEPAIDQSSFKTQMVELDKAVAKYRTGKKGQEQEIGALPQACHGPFSCTTKPICPDSDIPGLVGQRKLNLNETTTAHAEEHIFGPSAGKVRTAVKRANEILLKKLVDPKTGNITHVDWLFDQVLDPEAMNISNYWYLPGGHWKPKNCLPRWKVAILIPFRDRFHHLPIVLQNLIPMLQKQLLEFSFFVVEQANQELFNRAMLMNIGFLESLNFTDYDCFIIHDVDHVPVDDRNYYGCSSMPRHFVSSSDTDRWNNTPPYDAFFGAVTGLTKANIRSINGFPNVYWGWGGEDDEILYRVIDARLKITRDKGPITHYNVIKHHHISAPKSKDRGALLSTYKRRTGMDGLSDIVYPTPVYDLNTLYTNVSVDIKRVKVKVPQK